MISSLFSETWGVFGHMAPTTGKPAYKTFLNAVFTNNSWLLPTMNVLSSEQYTVCCIIEGEYSSSHWCMKYVTSVCLCRDSSRCSPKTGAASSALCRSNREVRETSTTSPCSAGRWLSFSSTSCPHPWFVTSLCRFFPTLLTDSLSATKWAGWSPTLDVGRLGGDENRSLRWKQPDHVSSSSAPQNISTGIISTCIICFCWKFFQLILHRIQDLQVQDWFTQKNLSKAVSIMWQQTASWFRTSQGFSGPNKLVVEAFRGGRSADSLRWKILQRMNYLSWTLARCCQRVIIISF